MQSQASLEVMNVLLIEDTPSDAELVRSYLEETVEEGYRVYHAPDMQTALDLMPVHNFQAVMLDLFLPDTEGLAGLAAVRSFLPSVPVLILTGRDDEDLAYEAVETGAQDYLIKDKIGPKMLSRSLRYAMQRKRYEDKIIYQANFDGLTGLPNRLQFKERADIALARQQRTGKNLALIMIDLDGFKEVNDTYGHQDGDEVLKEMGKRLPSCLRPYDFTARFGGDEFLVLVEEVEKVKDLEAIAEKIIGRICEPILLRHLTKVEVGASLGVVLSRKDERLSVDLLLHRADEAMYIAKKERGSCYRFYGQPARLATG